MNCNIMKGPLVAYVYEDISQKDKLLLEKHLASCPKCSVELQKLQETQLSCNYWQEQPVNENLLHNTFLKTKPEILTPEELAVYLRISVSEIINSVDNIPHFKIGKSIRFRRETIQQWIKQIEYIPYTKKCESRLVWHTPMNRIFDIPES